MNIKILVYLIILYFPLSAFGLDHSPKENLSPESTTTCLSFVFIPSNYNGYTISCPDAEDGSLTINAFGGVAPFSYLWENGSTSFQRNNLGVGTYSVTVSDANGCSLNSSITLQGASEISISKNIINEVSCINTSDGTLSAFVSGGAAPYSYEWTNGSQTPSSNNLACGIHSLTITDANGCIASAELILDCPEVIQINITPSSNFGGYNLSCPESFDGAVEVDIQAGAAPYQYLWSSGATNANANNLPVGISSLTVTDTEGCSAIAFVEMTAPQTMQLVPNIISDYESFAVSCINATDGEVSLEVVNGNAPFSFYWENGTTQSTATNLSAGQNQVTVTDATGCIIIGSVELNAYEISIIPEILSDFNGTPISCNEASDGILQMNVTAGASSPPNVTYVWNTGNVNTLLENISAGTYTLTVTSVFGCTASSEATLTAPSVVQTTATATSDYNGYNVSIQGLDDGIAAINTTGGLAPYSFLWENGGTNPENESLSAGTQNVTITDTNGCESQTSINLTEPTSLEGFADILSDYHGYDISCVGNDDGKAIAFASGAVPPYTFNWSNNMTGDSTEQLEAGTYQVTITDLNGATFISEVKLFDPPVIELEMQSTPSSNPADGTAKVIATGGTPPFSFEWNDAELQDGNQINQLATGWYRVTATDANGCQSHDQIEVKQSNEISCIKKNITITPNGDGMNDHLDLACIYPYKNNVEIYNRWGSIIFQAINYDGTWADLNQNKKIPDGGYFYIIRVVLPTGKKTFKGSLTIIR